MGTHSSEGGDFPMRVRNKRSTVVPIVQNTVAVESNHDVPAADISMKDSSIDLRVLHAYNKGLVLVLYI